MSAVLHSSCLNHCSSEKLQLLLLFLSGCIIHVGTKAYLLCSKHTTCSQLANNLFRASPSTYLETCGNKLGSNLHIISNSSSSSSS